MARNQRAPQMSCYPIPLSTDLLMEMWKCEETVWVREQAPIPSLASVDLKPHWNESFLSCAAAGLQGACKGPVYLCNKVIRGSVITRPNHCTFSLLSSPILSSVPVSSPPLPLPSLFHHPKNFFLKPHNYSNPFRWPLLTWRICLMWWCGCAGKSTGRIKQNVYCLKGSFHDSGFRGGGKTPYLYLIDCWVLYVWVREHRKEALVLCLSIKNTYAHWCWSKQTHFLLFQSRGKCA